MLAAIRHFVRLFIAITSTKFQHVHAAASLVPRPRPAFRLSRAGRAWERGYAAAGGGGGGVGQAHVHSDI